MKYKVKFFEKGKVMQTTYDKYDATEEEFKNELLKVKDSKKKDLDAFIELMVDTFFKVNSSTIP